MYNSVMVKTSGIILLLLHFLHKLMKSTSKMRVRHTRVKK
jgi:hypothetical protein